MPSVAQRANPRSTSSRPIGITVALSYGLTVRNARPASGSRVPTASQALANASPKRGEIPMTSPVDFISGPSSDVLAGELAERERPAP